MRRILALALAACLLLPTPNAGAAAATQVVSVAADGRKAERFVTTASGSLVVEPDGTVSSVDLRMSSPIGDAYREAIARWTFQPMRVDGAAVRAEARFTLRASGTVIAGTDQMRLAIDNVWFHESASLEGDEAHRHRPDRQSLAPPRYPRDPAIAGYGGSVDVLVKLDSEGRVVDAGIAGVALTRSAIRNVRQAETMARQLAHASVSAARAWVFTDREVIAAGSAIVPVTFYPPQEDHGGWKPQIPLDVTPLPWMLAAQAQAVALMPGGQSSASRFKLLSDVAGTTIN